jgi:hypothetical protein
VSSPTPRRAEQPALLAQSLLSANDKRMSTGESTSGNMLYEAVIVGGGAGGARGRNEPSSFHAPLDEATRSEIDLKSHALH